MFCHRLFLGRPGLTLVLRDTAISGYADLGGRLAQLVERLVYTENVGGSSPSPPTIAFVINMVASLTDRLVSVRHLQPFPELSVGVGERCTPPAGDERPQQGPGI